MTGFGRSQNSELSIDRLNLRLPDGFEKRADAIARETSRLLSLASFSQHGVLASIDVPAVKVFGGETNSVIAKRICRAIQMQLDSQLQQTSATSGVGNVD